MAKNFTACTTNDGFYHVELKNHLITDCTDDKGYFSGHGKTRYKSLLELDRRLEVMTFNVTAAREEIRQELERLGE
jgi:hypothetical protein